MMEVVFYLIFTIFAVIGVVVCGILTVDFLFYSRKRKKRRERIKQKVEGYESFGHHLEKLNEPKTDTMIRFHFEDEPGEDLTFGDVKDSQFFIDGRGYFCQKGDEKVNVIADPNGTPFSCNKNLRTKNP